MDCTVYMVKVSYYQKPYRRSMMQIWGSEVYPSPTDRTEAGKAFAAKYPDSPGSLGLAISEAVEDAVKHEDTKYSLGSVLNHVLLHQTVIGEEAKKQFEKIGEYPDILIGCVGGGSSFGGFTFPFVKDKLAGERPNLRVIAVEPLACPSLTKGLYVYDYGDMAGMTPLIKMYTLGHSFMPAPIHAGGLRYHGMAPLVCYLYDEKIIECRAVHQLPVFQAALQFAKAEGIIAAPEAAHGILVAIDEALKCKESGEKKVIAFNLTGHGNFDLKSYEDFFAGKLQDYELPQEKIAEALKDLPKVAGA
jgi:tryptophan synthase beta chain